MPAGQQSPGLIKDCSFSHYICLIAWLKTCPLEFSLFTFWPCQSWQGADSSKVLHYKTFLYHVVLCKHKRAPLHLSTRLFSPVFPLQTLDRWSYFPTWCCGKSWDAGQRSPTIFPGLPHAFGPWSGQTVWLSPFKKKKLKLAAPSEEGRKAENIPVPSG